MSKCVTFLTSCKVAAYAEQNGEGASSFTNLGVILYSAMSGLTTGTVMSDCSHMSCLSAGNFALQVPMPLGVDKRCCDLFGSLNSAMHEVCHTFPKTFPIQYSTQLKVRPVIRVEEYQILILSNPSSDGQSLTLVN